MKKDELHKMCYLFREVENKYDLNLNLENSWKEIDLENETGMIYPSG
jgi:hypothetical protein